MNKSYLQAVRIKLRKQGKSDDEIEVEVNKILGVTPMEEEKVVPEVPEEEVEVPEPTLDDEDEPV